jgi:hypothetical protein
MERVVIPKRKKAKPASRRRPRWEDDDDYDDWPRRRRRPLTEEEKRCERNIAAITRIVKALHHLDEARAALDKASNLLLWEVHSVNTPDTITADFVRFTAAGGCTLEQYKDWLQGSRLDPVPQKKHLRVVFSQKHRTSRIQLMKQQSRRATWNRSPQDDGPEAA